MRARLAEPQALRFVIGHRIVRDGMHQDAQARAVQHRLDHAHGRLGGHHARDLEARLGAERRVLGLRPLLASRSHEHDEWNEHDAVDYSGRNLPARVYPVSTEVLIMSTVIRKFRFLALPSLLALAACGAPPDGENATEGAEALVVRGPIPIKPVWVAPTYYAAGPSSSVPMASSASSVCLLQSVSGSLGGNASFAKVVTNGANYYLETGVGTQARAACAPWSDFTGTNTSVTASSVGSPWYLSSPPDGNANGYSSLKNPLWQGQNSACFVSGVAGNWLGAPYGSLTASDLSVFIGYEGGTYLGVMANGPGITGYADCFQFPQRSTASTTTSYAYAAGTPSVTLGATTSQGLCGLTWIDGELASTRDVVNIFEYGNGQQSLNIYGGVLEAAASCLLYQQQGS